MSGHTSHQPSIENTRNTARFFVESRQLSWVALIGVLAWGTYGYLKMPQRKDPDIPVRIAVASTPWPGASAEQVDLLVTKKLEQRIGQNSRVVDIKSVSRTGVSIIYFELDKNTTNTGLEFDDIKLKLDSIQDLPQGAGPIQFQKDFGDTATLMLTVASPKVSDVEIGLRAKDVRGAIEKVRPANAARPRVSVIVCFPQTIDSTPIGRMADLAAEWLSSRRAASDVRMLDGAGFVGIDIATDASDAEILNQIRAFVNGRLQAGEFHADAWQPALVRDPAGAQAALADVAPDKYSYRDMDSFTDLIERSLKSLEVVSKVSRTGLLDERIYLNYSQDRLASYGVNPGDLSKILAVRNVTAPGGVVAVQDKNVPIEPSGEFKSEKEIGNVIVTASSTGSPLYLRSLVDITRGYQSPPRFLNYFTARDGAKGWQRSRAVTLAVQMRQGQQIGVFAEAVDHALDEVRKQLPSDLRLARTSDQPRQVEENIHLFMTSLYEAIGLVVIVSLIGFWEWRSALLMALSIPLTLAMAFGFMYMLGWDLQQVSIATLIIALGLLVDDPVVAGDAIKRDLAAGHPSIIAAWLGPTKLATAILYATATNIAAYVPFVLLTGDIGRFIKSLPVVITCSLVASRLVSMTFIPLLGYYLLKPKAEPSIAERKSRGFFAGYYKLGVAIIHHRWAFLLGSFVFLAAGGWLTLQLKTQFFPKDLAYLAWVDVWLPEDAPFAATNEAALRTEAVIQREAESFGHPVLESLTTFVGGGGPRFWLSAAPEAPQLNYAQVLIQVKDKHDTQAFLQKLQPALLTAVPGARLDVRQLDTGKATGIPVQIQITGEDIGGLRAQAERVKDVLRQSRHADRVRDDWGAENFTLSLNVDADRANLAGITNLDVASSAAGGINGGRVAVLREGDKQIPVLGRLRLDERSRLSDVEGLYVYSAAGPQKIPLRQVSSLAPKIETAKIRRRNQFRAITVSCFPVPGALASEVLKDVMPQLDALGKSMPSGYKLSIEGEYKDQRDSFGELAVVMAVSAALIYLALVLQFRNAIKPFIVFAAIPYGAAGAIMAIQFMGVPFGFMAFLGLASLIGVIVSHIIVLFDFIEEKHAEGEPLIDALLDAGIMRLRPVMITVGATIIALFPLASHGGPLWEPLCYAQIGGLGAASFITLLLVPVIYSIFVLDLKLVKWDAPVSAAKQGEG
jgi:multidrug efflux pump subunit AcrB